MSRITFDSVVGLIVAELPNLSSSGAELFLDNPGQVAAEMMAYTRRLLRTQDTEENVAELRRVFALINRLAEFGDGSVEDLVETGMLQALTDSNEGLLAARAQLAPEPRRWLEQMLRTFLRPPGHPDIQEE